MLSSPHVVYYFLRTTVVVHTECDFVSPVTLGRTGINIQVLHLDRGLEFLWHKVRLQ